MQLSPENMADLDVRPSTKLLKPFYALAVLLIIAIVWFCWARNDYSPAFMLILPAILLLWAVMKHIQLRFTRMYLAAGRLRYETGMLSRTTRTIEIHKVQDVRVDQSLMQRMLSMGNISIETAGETSRLTMGNVDRPHDVADRILEAAQQGR
jgi:uncharacterized membrane protein YdbT with pleckstrin-like domain